MTYNVGAFGKYSSSNIENIAHDIKELSPDIISLNELDSCTARSNYIFQLKDLSESIGNMYYYFSPSIEYKGGKYGNGIAVNDKIKVISHKSFFLPKGDGSEQRSLIIIETDKFVFASTHLDHKSENARLLQIEKINQEIIGKYDKPVFLCGDFNALPNSTTIKTLEKNWTILSLKHTETFRRSSSCIDYIMILDNNPQYKVINTSVSIESNHSDHFPVYIDIILY